MLYEKVIALEKCTFTNTENLTREEWLNLRTLGIGGSDAGALLGYNKYATPLTVYLAKKEKSSFKGNKATEWGNILEDPIRQKTKEELGVVLEKVPGQFTSKENPFMNANLDGLIFAKNEIFIGEGKIEGLGGHEIKTSRTGDGFLKDEIPDSYYSQVQHYMAVTGLCYFVLTVFIFDSYEIRHYVINRNNFFIKTLINEEKDFWENNVLKNQPPAPTGNENERELVKSLSVAENIELPEEFSALLDKKSELEKQIKELSVQSDLIKEQVILKMNELSNGEDSEKSTAICNTWKITYNTQVRKTVDTDALKKAGLYDSYTKESVSKVLRISGGK